MPMVGILSSAVISAARSSGMHSRTTANAPASCTARASSITRSRSPAARPCRRPCTRWPPMRCTDWGVRPTWPMTGTSIEAITAIDVPVMGHVGLTPQSVHRMGGHRVQGRRHGRAAGERERVIDDARAVQEAGAFAVVLECIPLDLAAEITAALRIPTIGIGAGAHCDGQVLVLHDLLGLSTDWTPRFAKRYAELGQEVVRAAETYVREVKAGAFPTDAQAFAPPKTSTGAA